MSTEYLTCPLCEATCGLAVTVEDGAVSAVRGDAADVFSAGYICPKGASLPGLADDPDRLREPLVRRDGELVPATWDEAFAAVDAGLNRVIAEHGKQAVAVYLGNPGAHNLATQLYNRALIKAIGTKNVYSASSVDQLPKHVSSGYLFGDVMTIPIPDLDRTQYLLLLGANPLVSNGSLMTAPDVRGRLKRIRGRGGRIVVVDPARTRTAELADEHLAIRPGADPLLLFALVQVIGAEGLVRLRHLDGHVAGLDDVLALAAPFTPEAVAGAVGLPAEVIRRVARELAGADSAAVYGRIGTTTQRFGTVTSWLVDVLNVITGNLDRPGGAMFPLAAAGQANSAPGGKPFRHGRWTSRVRGLPEAMGELPVSTLAEEILTPGEGQVRALVTVGGNPCLSTPNAARLDEAVAGLDFVLSLDVYVNETSRHADVILPGPGPFSRPHYDLAFYQLAVRNVANWSAPVLPTDVPQEWETILRIVGALSGLGPDSDVAALDELVAADVARRAGLDPSVAGDRRGPARLVDLLLRSGPREITLADLEAAPHGIDFGPLEPRVPGLLSTASGLIELAPEPIVADVARLRASLTDVDPDGFVLVGRRQLRSNNSWMHNVLPLVRGSNRCTALLHPEDAARLAVAEGDDVLVRSRVGEIRVPVELSETMRPGVVSIPHGWGHGAPGTRTSVAGQHPGVNSNVLTDDLDVDAVSGTVVLNGIPVSVTAAPAVDPALAAAVR